MIGVVLVTIGSFFGELGASLGKVEISRRKESIYTYGFLSLFLSTLVFFFIAVFVRGEFVFSVGSLPTLGARAILEIFQSYVSIKALTVADRSTFGFIRVGTIPLLLIVDVALGYVLTAGQAIGASILTLSILILFLNHGLRRKGVWLVLLSTVNAVVTISLFKYNIANFNSVEVEQGIIQLVLLFFFVFMARRNGCDNPLKLLFNPSFFTQSFSQAVAGILVSFGYGFLPASVATSVSRSASVFFSVISGHQYFHEKKLVQKLFAFLLLLLGFAFLAGISIFKI